MEPVHVRAAAAAGVVTLVTSFGLVIPTASAKVAVNLRPVAVEGQTQTATGKIGEITAQTINNAGQVSFRATYEDPAVTGGTGTGNFIVAPGGAPQLVGGEGKAAPGTSAFFGSAALGPLNGLGQVAFNTTLQGGDVDPTLHNNNALYLGTPALQQLVAREGDQAPEAPAGVIYARSATAGPFGTPLLNHAGQVAYAARLGGTGVGTSNAAGLFVGAPGAVRMLSRAGDPTPIPGMNFVGAYTSPSVSPSLSPVLNDGGQVLFRDSLRDATTGSLTNQEGLFLGSSRNNLSVVLKTGDAAPDAPAGTTVAFPATSLAINNRGQIAVGTALNAPGGGAAAALYQGTPGDLHAVFRTGDAAPQTTAGVVFNDLFHGQPIVMNASGKTAFQAMLQGGDAVGSFRDQGLFTGTPGDVDLVARLGDHAPGTAADVVFRNLFGVAMNAPGQLAFEAALGVANSDQSAGFGLFGYDPSAGVSLIARTGDTFDLGAGQTGTVRSFAFNAESGGQDGRLVSINDAGQVAFTMGFAEGTSGGVVTERRGLFVASVVPEPTGALLGLVFGTGALLQRRRAR